MLEAIFPFRCTDLLWMTIDTCVPESPVINPAIGRGKVDLPEPEAPISATISQAQFDQSAARLYGHW